MHLLVSTFWCPKDGSSDEQYEDAYAPSDGTYPVGDRFRAAVADGATEGYLSGEWAASLTAAWIELPKAPPARVVGQARTDFASRLGKYRARRAEEGRPLAWYEESKLDDGAFATFAGVTITSEGEVFSAAIGDSCVLHIRSNRIRHSFPLRTPAEFGLDPQLIASTGRLRGLRMHHERVLPGDTIMLCTDAFAHLMLSAAASHRTLPPLPAAGLHDEFRAWVADLRGAGRLRNDDTTLLRISVLED